MTRRVSLPGASELFFRSTTSPALDPARGAENGRSAEIADPAPVQRGDESENTKRELSAAAGARRGSPRTKHDAKITVYVSQAELIALEHARLALRAGHDLAVDRGRLVREAVAVILADFDEHGEDSVLVRRLRSGHEHDQERTTR
ncbi:MAG: cobyrinic acid a,c-diamide synthase [Haloechinothrix sp.]